MVIRKRRSAAWAVLAVGWGLLMPVGPASAQDFLPPVQVGTVQSGSINEASGLDASVENPGVLWVHNDSGDTARAFAMNTAGDHLGIYNLTGLGATDWEDISLGPDPNTGDSYLYLGDIGDNNAVRSSIQIHRVLEPTVSASQSPVTVSLTGVETFTLLYPDGPRDAETLMVDPLTGDIYIISKRDLQPRVYRAPFPQSSASPITLDYLGLLPWGLSFPVGGDISPDGDEIIVRGAEVFTHGASLWTRSPGQSIWDALSGSPLAVPAPSEPQGEAIAFDADGDGYFTVSEGVNQPVYYIQRLGPGDFDEDGDVDADDIDLLCANIGGAPDPYDLDGDNDVDLDDQTLLIETLVEWSDGVTAGVGTRRGDWNLDGQVNVTDLQITKAYFGQSGLGWAQGDGNCDGLADLTDLQILKADFGYAASPVPEPATLSVLTLGVCSHLLKRRKS